MKSPRTASATASTGSSAGRLPAISDKALEVLGSPLTPRAYTQAEREAIENRALGGPSSISLTDLAEQRSK